jgi:hypothetical protein
METFLSDFSRRVFSNRARVLVAKIPQAFNPLEYDKQNIVALQPVN